MVLRGEHARDARRFLDGAIECVRTLEAFGIAPRGETAAIDPPRSGATPSDRNQIVLEATPWWSSSTAMVSELAAARALARHAWSEATGASSIPAWFVDGLVEYTARRAVTPLFQRSNLPPGFAMLDMRYFGGYVPWRIRIRLDATGTADALPAYRRQPRVDPSSARVDGDPSLDGKALLTLNTLDRWIGRPAFDAALAEFARQAHARPVVLADFTAVASSAAGQDLSWMLTPMLSESVTYDYAVAELHSDAAAGGRFDTVVTVERRGAGQFTGAASPRTGPFDSGRGLTILTTFTDGDRIVDTWDGRDRRKTFTYRSAARATAAEIDPEMRLLLDLNRTNNSIVLETRTATAASRWSMRWLLWLQQVLLTYGALA